MKSPKIETLAEYLARGGTIKIITPTPYNGDDVIKQIAGGSIKILSYEEATLYSGETKRKKQPKSKSITSSIDLSVFPSELRDKLLNRYINGEHSEEEE